MEEQKNSMNIQWYPGHMTKTRRMMEEDLKLVDAVCEILDARIPISSRNPDIDAICGKKPRMVILNRIDMADADLVSRWSNYFKDRGMAVIRTDCKSRKGINTFAPAVRQLLAEKLQRYAEKGQVGRPLKLMVVGIPNVGKSTLFNAITSTKNAEAANYPFCTIEPNSGIVAVPDKRLDKLAEIWQTNKKTPAIVEFVDIAGLVKGASQGAGLGNKFLGHIRECDAIVHVVRCFDDDNIIHVVEDVTKAEAVDPIADIDAIDYELILSDLEVVQNRAGRMAKAAKSGNNKGAAAEAAWLQQLAAHLESGKPARSFDFDENDAEQQTVLHEMGLLSAKPVLYACNVGEDDLMEGIENNKYVPLVAARAKEEGARYIPICAKTEEDIADYSPEEKKAFLAEMGIEASGLDNLITASYDLLGLISFLTDGKKECRAWTIRKGTKAPQAAGKIHSDFERGFIRASVIAYSDLEAHDFDYAAVKAKGLQRTEGKEYVVKDGDVIEFLFNV